MKNQLRLDLRTVVYRDGASWCAHCLELDLVQSAPTVARAIRDLMGAIKAHLQYGVDHDDAAGAFRPAPAEYWQMYFKASESLFKVKFSKPIRRFEIRELAA